MKAMGCAGPPCQQTRPIQGTRVVQVLGCSSWRHAPRCRDQFHPLCCGSSVSYGLQLHMVPSNYGGIWSRATCVCGLLWLGSSHV
jgi:hypothetical protein